MVISYRHIMLLIGISLVIISFLWFGRETETYNILLAIGLILASLSFLAILFSSDKKMNKLIWILIVIISIVLQWVSEPVFIKLSYLIFINEFKVELLGANNLMESKQEDLMIVPDKELSLKSGFSEDESNEIKSLFDKTGIQFISKDSTKIYYKTWGNWAVSHGVYFFFKEPAKDKHYKRITDNWYY